MPPLSFSGGWGQGDTSVRMVRVSGKRGQQYKRREGERDKKGGGGWLVTVCHDVLLKLHWFVQLDSNPVPGALSPGTCRILHITWTGHTQATCQDSLRIAFEVSLPPHPLLSPKGVSFLALSTFSSIVLLSPCFPGCPSVCLSMWVHAGEGGRRGQTARAGQGQAIYGLPHTHSLCLSGRGRR
jgi:hypothetical protein